MRLGSIVTALLVMASLYMLVFERDTLVAFAAGDAAPEATDSAEATVPERPAVAVVARHSVATPIDQIVLVRGRTEAARQVNVMAETSGPIVSEPLRKGSFVEAGDLLCEIDSGTRETSVAEMLARLAEAESRVPEARARLAEAAAALPAAEAGIGEAEARVPEAKARLAEALAGVTTAEARLAEALAGVPTAEARLDEAMAGVPTSEARLVEAEAGVPAAEARLAEARSRLPEAEARVVEAEARVSEAEINLNAAKELAEGGFASETRVAAAVAAMESARAGLQAARSQFEGAKAGVENALAQVEGARAAVQSAKGLVESALAQVQSAKGAVESARAQVQSARGAVESARAGVQSARSQIESAAAGVISARSRLEGARATVESANSGVESARAGIQSAEAAVAAAEKEIDRLSITAPFAGLLESDTAELGSLMQPGALCATIIQLDPIKLVGFVPETEVAKVSVGAMAGARLATGDEVVGQVTFLSRAADPNTRTFRVEVQVPNADLAIRDGQTAEIVIRAPGLDAHLIPQSALTLDDDGRLGVRLVDAEARAAFRAVEVLRDTTEGVYVSGLPAAADIIVVGQEFVTDGVPVAPTYAEAGK